MVEVDGYIMEVDEVDGFPSNLIKTKSLADFVLNNTIIIQ